MTKHELLGQLENAKNNYILGLSALSLFAEESSLAHLENSNATFGSYNVPFAPVARLLRIPSARGIAVKEFMNMLLRTLIKESFELLKNYCLETSQGAMFKAEPWYHFARIIRNCLSHNFVFSFSRFDRTFLPASWRLRSIREDMVGTPLALSFFGYVEAWELFCDFSEFASARLS